MIQKIGRFDAYVPDRDIFSTILEILSLTSLRQNDEIISPLHKLHLFFYRLKEKYPDIFEDIFFNHDPSFPYSKQIEDSFTRLQESAFIARPNPSLNRYRIDVDLNITKPDKSRADYGVLQKIANDFQTEFGLQDEPA